MWAVRPIVEAPSGPHVQRMKLVASLTFIAASLAATATLLSSSVVG